MALSKDEIRKYSSRLMASKLRLLCNHGFYGLLISHMKFSIDEECNTAYTDGERIAFNPEFMDGLKDSELDFVLMHEILHVALSHCFRMTDKITKIFNIACDIVVNSNVLKSVDMDESSITLGKYGTAMHVAPDGKEGYLYTAEEVYYMLIAKYGKSLLDTPYSEDGGEGDGDDSCKSGNNSDSKSSDKKRGKSRGSGMDGAKNKGGKERAGGGSNGKNNGSDYGNGFDQHDKWCKKSLGEDSDGDVWSQRVRDAAEVMRRIESSKGCGSCPAGVERMLGELNSPSVDWRTVLNDFVHEEVVDYSFSPPDRRFSDSDFFIPDLNEKDDRIEKILFMIDTSASMSDSMISEAYSELSGALIQFNGKLKGLLGFFDAAAYPAVPFENVQELLGIRPRGGGGTDFMSVFKYVRKELAEDPPVSIVILTDGYCSFPDESEAMGIPVLWLLNNNNISPPWGQVARMENR